MTSVGHQANWWAACVGQCSEGKRANHEVGGKSRRLSRGGEVRRGSESKRTKQDSWVGKEVDRIAVLLKTRHC